MHIIARFPVPLDPSNGYHHFIRRSNNWKDKDGAYQCPDPLWHVQLTIGAAGKVVIGQTYSISDARRFADMAALRFKRNPKFNHSRRQAELDTEQMPNETKWLDEMENVHKIPDDPRDLLQRVKDLEERLNAIEGL